MKPYLNIDYSQKAILKRRKARIGNLLSAPQGHDNSGVMCNFKKPVDLARIKINTKTSVLVSLHS